MPACDVLLKPATPGRRAGDLAWNDPLAWCRRAGFSHLMVGAARHCLAWHVFPIHQSTREEEEDDVHDCLLAIDLARTPDTDLRRIIHALTAGGSETWAYQPNPPRSVRM